MLIVKSGIKLDLEKSHDNQKIIITNGTIIDTKSNIAYIITDNFVMKKYNTTLYIYYNIYTTNYEAFETEYPIENLTIDKPNLCPVVKVTIDNINITSYSYFVLKDLSFDQVVQGEPIKIKNSSKIIYETVYVTNDIVSLVRNILGIISIYVINKSFVDLESSILYTENNTIKFVDTSLSTEYIKIAYLTDE